jgi:DNA-binding CsgD family transcriptional regulator
MDALIPSRNYVSTEVAVGRSKLLLEFDPTEQVVFISHVSPTQLATHQEISAYYGAIRRFWRLHCRGEKAYWVVSLDNLSVESNRDIAEHYAKTIRETAEECVLTSVRYGGSMLQRMTSRMAALQRHEALNVYSSREEAIDVVPETGGEAVLTPGGKVLHAVGETRAARDALRRLAVAIDRARGRLRHHDPEAALEGLAALVDGRWSLVDKFESDGKRFVLAIPNAPTARDPRALTARERAILRCVAMGHSNKLIAYTLGLAEGTISASVASIKRKLGLPSRPALVMAGTAPERRDHLEFELAGQKLHLLAERVADSVDEDAFRRLTAAEREVAELAIRGDSSQRIALQRGCSPRTVDNLLGSIFRKLGLASRAELTLRAASHAGRRKG